MNSQRLASCYWLRMLNLTSTTQYCLLLMRAEYLSRLKTVSLLKQHPSLAKRNSSTGVPSGMLSRALTRSCLTFGNAILLGNRLAVMHQSMNLDCRPMLALNRCFKLGVEECLRKDISI